MSKNYTIDIEEISPVAFAVPGIRKVCTGDTVAFHNATSGTIKIRMAADDVLKGLEEENFVKVLSDRTSEQFEVLKDSGTHEISVHYSYKDKKKKNKLRTGFAIGASSPKIIIVRPR